MLMNIIYRLPSIRKFIKENKALKEKNKLLFQMYQLACEKNASYQDTLNEITSKVGKNRKESIKDSTEESLNENIDIPAFVFNPVAQEDETINIAEEIVSSNPFGMAAEGYLAGEKVKYQELSDEGIDELLQFCYGNVSKEITVDLGNNRSGIIESHHDNSLSLELYEDTKHMKSMKTGKKIINKKVVTDYGDDDIIDVLNSFGGRG